MRRSRVAKCGCLGCRATGCISDGMRERRTSQGRLTEARRNGWMPGGARTTRASSKFLRTFGGSHLPSGALPCGQGLPAAYVHRRPRPLPFLRAPCGSLPLHDGRCCSRAARRTGSGRRMRCTEEAQVAHNATRQTQPQACTRTGLGPSSSTRTWYGEKCKQPKIAYWSEC
jgi:hypothetical protein